MIKYDKSNPISPHLLKTYNKAIHHVQIGKIHLEQ